MSIGKRLYGTGGEEEVEVGVRSHIGALHRGQAMSLEIGSFARGKGEGGFPGGICQASFDKYIVRPDVIGSVGRATDRGGRGGQSRTRYVAICRSRVSWLP